MLGVDGRVTDLTRAQEMVPTVPGQHRAEGHTQPRSDDLGQPVGAAMQMAVLKSPRLAVHGQAMMAGEISG